MKVTAQLQWELWFMIILAYDGSIYNDWVARYAIQFATTERDRKLLVLHVVDGSISPEVIQARFTSLAAESDSFGIEFMPHHLPLGQSVYRTLRQATPSDSEALLMCGTRVKPRRKSYLTGTVAEKLLRIHQCPVLALRVVQPGLLGNPHNLFLPLAGHRHAFARVEPIVRRLAPHLKSIELMRAMKVNPMRHPHISSAMEWTIRQKGMAFLAAFQKEMDAAMKQPVRHCDRRVILASDWAHEVLVQASHLKAQLMLLGLSERSLAYRVFHSASVEKILQETPCDVGVYRGP